MQSVRGLSHTAGAQPVDAILKCKTLRLRTNVMCLCEVLSQSRAKRVNNAQTLFVFRHPTSAQLTNNPSAST